MREPMLPPREIFDSAGKLVAWLLACCFLAGGAVLMMVNQGNALWFGILWLAVILPLTMSLVARLASIARPLIVLDDFGILDRRVSPKPIRWATVQMVNLIRTRLGVAGAQLVMSDRDYNGLKRSRLRQLLQPLRTFLSPVSGVAISAFGLQITGQELFDLCSAYSRLHKVQDEPANV